MRQRGTLQLDHLTWRLQLRRTDEAGKVRRTWARIGSKAELPTRAAARRAADRYLERINPREVHAGTPMDWGAWCDRYIDRWLSMHASGTQATQASIITKHLRSAFTGSVHEIDLVAVQGFIHAQRKAGVAPSTVRARFNVLRRMLRQAVEEGLATVPAPAGAMKFPKDEAVHEAVRQKAFTAEECEAILGSAAQPEVVAYALARYLGLRTGEVLGLTWPCIDLASGRVTIRQQAIDGKIRPLKTKGSAAVLQAPPALLKHLQAYRLELQRLDLGGETLFPDRDGKPWTAPALRERLHVLLDWLGLRRRGMHAFRHACALGMADAGCSPEVIRRAMRHSSLAITALYLSAAPEDIAAGLARGAISTRGG